MKILVVGSGGREHAVVDALSANPNVRKIYVAPGNGGIAARAELMPINAADVWELLKFARGGGVDLTFVGPEVPLSKGIVDIFRQNGLAIIGPTADHARLESSKSYAKRFCETHRIPTAAFKECSTPYDACIFLERAAYPLVIKADGLAAGKGVVIAEDHQTAQETVRLFMENRSLGDAGSKLVIEQFLPGEEASFHVFADGTDFQPMVVSQDHKRRFDGDTGPNTGGMGAYSFDAILSENERQTVIEQIIQPTLAGAGSYSGILYAGLMLTAEGPKVIEYNARFGDPETQVILPRLKTDLLDILVDMAEHRLGSRKLEWFPDVAATVVLVSSGYPGNVETGKRIQGIGDAEKMEGVKIHHAGTALVDGGYYTAGGRVLNVTAKGSTLDQALDRAYAAVEVITFDGKSYRKDIGKKGLLKSNDTSGRHHNGQ